LAGKDVDPGAESPGGDGEANAGARGVLRKNDGIRRDLVMRGKN